MVDQGLLRGFVVLHPRWAGFQPEDYLQASAAVHKGEEEAEVALSPWKGFELARAQLFPIPSKPLWFSSETGYG